MYSKTCKRIDWDLSRSFPVSRKTQVHKKTQTKNPKACVVSPENSVIRPTISLKCVCWKLPFQWNWCKPPRNLPLLQRARGGPETEVPSLCRRYIYEESYPLTSRPVMVLVPPRSLDLGTTGSLVKFESVCSKGTQTPLCTIRLLPCASAHEKNALGQMV